MHTFKEGDLVSLLSGGTTMTVEHVGSVKVSVVWFDSAGLVQRDAFPAAALHQAGERRGKSVPIPLRSQQEGDTEDKPLRQGKRPHADTWGARLDDNLMAFEDAAAGIEARVNINWQIDLNTDYLLINGQVYSVTNHEDGRGYTLSLSLPPERAAGAFTEFDLVASAGTVTRMCSDDGQGSTVTTMSNHPDLDQIRKEVDALAAGVEVEIGSGGVGGRGGGNHGDMFVRVVPDFSVGDLVRVRGRSDSDVEQHMVIKRINDAMAQCSYDDAGLERLEWWKLDRLEVIDEAGLVRPPAMTHSFPQGGI